MLPVGGEAGGGGNGKASLSCAEHRSDLEGKRDLSR